MDPKRNRPVTLRAALTNTIADDQSTALQGQQFPRCDNCNARMLHHATRLCWDCKRPQQRHADLGLVDADHRVGGAA